MKKIYERRYIRCVCYQYYQCGTLFNDGYMIIIMGLPGVGKSTLLSRILEKNQNLKIINYGDLVLSSASKKFNITDRDKINILPLKDHLEIQKEAIRQISNEIKQAESEGKILILDTHAVLKKPSGYLPGLAPEIFNLPIHGFIFIDAPTNEILERREKDKKRRRPNIEKEEINALREISLSFISQYSAASGKPFFILINRKGKLERSAVELEEIIEKLTSKI
jgi:adenylate kinase